MHPEDPHEPNLPAPAQAFQCFFCLIWWATPRSWLPLQTVPHLGPAPPTSAPAEVAVARPHNWPGGQFCPPTLIGNWDQGTCSTPHQRCLQQSQSFEASWARDRPACQCCLQQSWPSYQEGVHSPPGDILELLAQRCWEGCTTGPMRLPTKMSLVKDLEM